MKKGILFIILFQFSLQLFSQIIADHTVVDKFDQIPQYYIDEVKKMWLSYAGESHSAAIRDGLDALEALNAAYAVNVTESGTPEAYTTSHLRASRATWGDVNNSSGWIYSYGEGDWFTSANAISRTKAGISYCNSNDLTIGVFGFGWCWDIGIDFNEYISATQDYVDYCADSIDTRVIFTTGTVDTYTGEDGYVKHLGYESIRDYVASDAGLVLFDYADILCYNDAGELETYTWNGHTYPLIHPDNEDGAYTGHIGMNGAVRLAKAMWWMMARIAGWDGGVTSAVPVESISLSAEGGSASISSPGGTLQLYADVLPSDATDPTVSWSVTDGTGHATISSSGLVTARANGTVTARATANDGSGVYGTLEISISGQAIPVSSISVSGESGSSSVTTEGGTLQLYADVLPSDATDPTVSWSVTDGTGHATISSSGLVTARANGTVTARATANDGSGVYGTLEISISGQAIPVSSISVSGESGSSSVTTEGGTLQLYADVLPSDATDPTVSWSVTNGSGEASISSSGLVTARANGTVTARATANDGSGVYGTLEISISNQFIPVSAITVSSEAGSAIISSENGTLQLMAHISPPDATSQAVSWSVTNVTGQAVISPEGLVTAISEGLVRVFASAEDGSGISTMFEILIEFSEYHKFRIIMHDNYIEAAFDADHSGYHLNLFDFHGNLKSRKKVNGTSCLFNISSLPRGTYLLVLSRSGIYYVEKLIVPE